MLILVAVVAGAVFAFAVPGGVLWMRPALEPAFAVTMFFVGTLVRREQVHAFLHAPPGSPDFDALERLKRHNAATAAAILADWQAEKLPTERDYLRRKIRQARDARPG